MEIFAAIVSSLAGATVAALATNAVISYAIACERQRAAGVVSAFHTPAIVMLVPRGMAVSAGVAVAFVATLSGQPGESTATVIVPAVRSHSNCSGTRAMSKRVQLTVDR